MSGDKEAVDALATVHAKFAQASTDRTVLAAARAAAAKLESAVDDADTEAKRAATMKQAVELSGKFRLRHGGSTRSPLSSARSFTNCRLLSIRYGGRFRRRADPERRASGPEHRRLWV